MGSLFYLLGVKCIQVLESRDKIFNPVFQAGLVVFFITVEMGNQMPNSPPLTTSGIRPLFRLQAVETGLNPCNFLIERQKRV